MLEVRILKGFWWLGAESGARCGGGRVCGWARTVNCSWCWGGDDGTMGEAGRSWEGVGAETGYAFTSVVVAGGGW